MGGRAAESSSQDSLQPLLIALAVILHAEASFSGRSEGISAKVEYMESTETTFNVTLLQDGNIQLRFLTAAGETLFALCTPEQVGEIATSLLSAGHASANLVGSPPQPAQLGQVKINAAIPVSQWYFGNIGWQQAVIVETGRTKIGFAVGRDQLRGLGRVLIAASWRGAISHPSLRPLIIEFGTELRFWGTFVWSKFMAKARERSTALRTWLSGRSFRSFSVVHVGPGIEPPSYTAFGECIYCHSKTYSQKPQMRKSPLGAEHIVAEGLGGTLELPEASCQECENATGAVVEGAVVGRTLKAIRVYLRLRKAGSGPFPKTLPLEAKILGQQKTLEVPIEDYPVVFGMYAYAAPNLDSTEGMPRVVSTTIVQLKLDLRMLFQKYGIGEFATPYLDNVMMCLMLAKIGHALAIAELGRDKFEPLLTNLIRFGTDRMEMKFVGGTSRPITGSRNRLHSLALGFQKIKDATYVVAHVQLFASHGGPTYSVVVGKSLESSMARFKRVFLSRVSLARQNSLSPSGRSSHVARPFGSMHSI